MVTFFPITSDIFFHEEYLHVEIFHCKTRFLHGTPIVFGGMEKPRTEARFLLEARRAPLYLKLMSLLNSDPAEVNLEDIDLGDLVHGGGPRVL